MRAALYAIPTPLGAAPAACLPDGTLATVRSLRDFVAENAKSARAFLADAGIPCPIRELRIEQLTADTPATDVPALLRPLHEGRPLGLLSEAGCPGVADPGASLVAAAHLAGFSVVPLVGPSSLLLALMASGLEGQRFAFHGYLPRDKVARERRIREIERRSRKEIETQIFIETPYRNGALFDSLLCACDTSTRLCIASDLTLATETVSTRTIADWRRTHARPGKRPTVFLLQGG